MRIEARMQDNLQLQSAYENAKARGSELAALSRSSPPHLRNQLLQASKTYHAISTVIFASICINQIGELENFIQNASQSLPTSLYEASEWASAIEAAENSRASAGIGAKQLPVQVSIVESEDSLNEGAVKIAEMQKSLALLSKDVSAEITTMNTSLSMFKSQLVPLLKKETQRYSELQAKFNEIEEINEKTLKSVREEAAAKLNDEIAERTQLEAKLEDMKYSYESEIESLKETITAFESSAQQKLVHAQELTIQELKRQIEQMTLVAEAEDAKNKQTIAQQVCMIF